jgi:hypothetical protein
MSEVSETFRTPGRSMGSGQLRCGNLALNEADGAHRLVQALTQIVREPKAWHRLEVDKELYFKTPEGSLSTDPGWYIICDGHQTPLYPGKAENLDYRLNSTNGSLDNFAHSQRMNDPVRNFIKRLSTIGCISGLCVAVIREADLLARIGMLGPLDDVERGAVEKVLGLFRYSVVAEGAD